MLAVLASVALVVGGFSFANAVATSDNTALKDSQSPVVEVQAIETADPTSNRAGL